ncbi:RNA-binding protein [Pedobacter sp. HMF7647]|uniref:RNA-binding protein n=1 Tax=Hufsiella arboris TaxID=2695275 RepID=A0A7K1Y8H8_9SPHI|nr:VCBS repeat-containing protein [Hufsiella arboris]MXV50877.1 RNA-binding protein [Hufsiella arboris]
MKAKLSRPIIYVTLLTSIAFSCTKKKPLFELIPSAKSGITFNNKITETDSINAADMINVYNGGGVGVGDFNNDGLQDIYFTGNLVSNKLYLNKGDFKFQDITKEANASGNGRWCRGVSVVDINNDGLLDIYVCASIDPDPQKRQNLLYINLGADKDKIPHFKEMAADYGLNDTTHSTMAAFFDYDNDGDLDTYIAVNENIRTDNPNVFRPIHKDGSYPSTGRLYRNDYNSKLGHAVYTNVSKQAGITTEGFAHGVTISDLNRDGWPDIYVTNDFLSNDLLYINNHDGTFTDQSKDYFKHTAATAMGQDIEDINNDGLQDVITLDMNPEDNYRKKMMLNSNSYQIYQNFDFYGYQYQYVRNTLQLNQGPTLGENDSIKHPVFSDIGFMAGIAETDWSWTPLVIDFDNDGNRDIIVTNGYPKDVTDHDFMVFRQQAFSIASKKELLEQIPQVKIHNYAYKNNGNLTFSDVSSDWGMTTPSYSNGATYADLDNDGDLDIIINNINDESMLYKNTARDSEEAGNYLNIQLTGDKNNINGLGSWIDIYYDKTKHQTYESTPFRGYLSSVQNQVHFGLGNVSIIDSVVISWPNQKKQVLKNIKPNQVLKANISEASVISEHIPTMFADASIFKEVTHALNINYVHKEHDFADFNVQKLLPHKLSEFSPALASGDINGDGLDDIVCGGSSDYPAQIFLQQSDGKFMQKNLNEAANATPQQYKDGGLLLFDADGDHDLDLYIAGSGYEQSPGSPSYQDRLYLNDGQGNFQPAIGALPQNLTSKLCVRAIDYDRDGDLDLFVSGRVDPWNYPKPVSSFIFRNDSKNGNVKFTDVTSKIAGDLNKIGMICDALFTDFDNDGWQDLVVIGEWMPVTFLKNEHGTFKNVTAHTGTETNLGWWNTIASGDFDNDGDIDYIVGNQGLNSFFKASNKYPVYITAKDFDNNGSYDAFPSLFLPVSQDDQTRKEFPAQGRDDIVKQMISMRIRFQNYKSLAAATFDELFTPEQRKDALRLEATQMQSGYFQNDGDGHFTFKPLPMEAQISMLCGMVVDDFDGDGNLDVVINGNDFGTSVNDGRYDAFNGLFLKGNGHGEFKPLSILKSGIYLPGNGKATIKVAGRNGSYLLAATQNKGAMKVFELKRKTKTLRLNPDDVRYTVSYSNGKKNTQEAYYGTSFLSQSSRFIKFDAGMRSINITNNKGVKRTISLTN